MKKRRHRGPPEHPETFGEAALYIAARTVARHPGGGRAAWEAAKKALVREFGPWQPNRPLTPAVRGWIARRWRIQIPGEILLSFCPRRPAPATSMVITHIPFVPDDQLADAYAECERRRQGLAREVAALTAEVERLQAIIDSRLAKAARDGGKR